MKCPVDNETLMMTERNGVEIDYCPKCRGVWLDRGELDKIIDQSASAPAVQSAAPVRLAEPAPVPQPDPYPRHPRPQHRDRRYYDDDDDDYRPRRKHRKRESFLSELFDF